jgi:hypothetical protein
MQRVGFEPRRMASLESPLTEPTLSPQQNNYWRSLIKKDAAGFIPVLPLGRRPSRCCACNVGLGRPTASIQPRPQLHRIDHTTVRHHQRAVSLGAHAYVRPEEAWDPDDDGDPYDTGCRRGSRQVASRREISGASSCPHQSLCMLTWVARLLLSGYSIHSKITVVLAFRKTTLTKYILKNINICNI